MDTKDKIKVMQAYLDGEDIHIKNTLNNEIVWDSFTCLGQVEPIWDWSNFEYRIKPKEPRVLYVIDLGNGELGSANFLTLKGARNFIDKTTLNYKIVKMTETEVVE